jgi:hypothetical protein
MRDCHGTSESPDVTSRETDLAIEITGEISGETKCLDSSETFETLNLARLSREPFASPSQLARHKFERRARDLLETPCRR